MRQSSPVAVYRDAITPRQAAAIQTKTQALKRLKGLPGQEAGEEHQPGDSQTEGAQTADAAIFAEVPSQTPAPLAPRLYAQASTASDGVTDAGAGSASTAATPASTITPTTATPTLGGSGMFALSGLAVVVLAAAGRSEGGPAPTPTPPADSTAPVFTEGASKTVAFAENTATTTMVHTAVATDNVALTAYALAGGGADNDKFNLNTATGALTFKTVPDFEALGSAAGSNSYTVKVKALDAAGNSTVQTITVNVTDVADVDDTVPVFTDGASKTVALAENTATATVVHTAAATDNVAVTAYALDGGADDNKFSLNTATGALTFISSPDFEALGSAAGNNTYTVRVRASDAVGNNAVQTVTVNVTDVFDSVPTNSSEAFTLWQEAELAWLGDGSKNINALNQHSAAIMQHRDTTSVDGSATQSDPAKRLSQYINQVTGTDIVSDAEFDAGFTITGKASAGAQSTIKFLLDKDRTTGVDGEGAQVLNLGANDVDNLDGDNNHATGTDVTATYNNTTGDWSLAFAPGSGALLQATHNTHGSGVHQLLVDTDGNGSRTGSGAVPRPAVCFWWPVERPAAATPGL